MDHYIPNDCEVKPMLNIETIQSAVHEAASHYPVKRVELFGSYANGTATEKSDVDLLVEFKESPISVLKICGFQQTVIDLLSMHVDVVELPLQKTSGLLIDKKVCVYES